MLPTRKRPDKVMRCIESIYSSASYEDWEMVVAIDDDDAETLKLRSRMLEFPRLKIFVGPKLGYDLLDRGYYNTISYLTEARWVFVCNDDMTLSGDWLNGLRNAPNERAFCQPEIHGLGNSEYPNDNRTGSPFFLHGSWREAGWEVFPQKADYILTAKLEEMGWPCHFLKGVKVWHDRGHNHEYDEHHKL